jgi:hypothetical protein
MSLKTSSSSSQKTKERSVKRREEIRNISSSDSIKDVKRRYQISDETLDTRNRKSKVTREENKEKKERRNAILARAREKKQVIARESNFFNDNSKSDRSNYLESLFDPLFRSNNDDDGSK